jgi:hypothetical protein
MGLFAADGLNANFYIPLVNLISRENSDIIFIERMKRGINNVVE